MHHPGWWDVQPDVQDHRSSWNAHLRELAHAMQYTCKRDSGIAHEPFSGQFTLGVVSCLRHHFGTSIPKWSAALQHGTPTFDEASCPVAQIGQCMLPIGPPIINAAGCSRSLCFLLLARAKLNQFVMKKICNHRLSLGAISPTRIYAALSCTKNLCKICRDSKPQIGKKFEMCTFILKLFDKDFINLPYPLFNNKQHWHRNKHFLEISGNVHNFYDLFISCWFWWK